MSTTCLAATSGFPELIASLQCRGCVFQWSGNVAEPIDQAAVDRLAKHRAP